MFSPSPPSAHANGAVNQVALPSRDVAGFHGGEEHDVAKPAIIRPADAVEVVMEDCRGLGAVEW